MLGCSAGSGDADLSATADLTVTRGDLQDVALVTGILESVRSDVLVSPRTRSWRVSIRHLAEDGARVAAGETVLEFDRADLSSQLEERKLQALEAENKLVRERANNAVIEADKAFAVAETDILLRKAVISAEVPEDLLPKREYQERMLLQKRTAVALAKVEDALAAHRQGSALATEIEQIALSKAKRDIEAAERELSSLSLQAPRDGLLIVKEHPWLDRKFKAGDTLQPGWAVVEIPDLSSMQVLARLSDVDDGRIAAGMPVTCVLDAFPDLQFKARVQEISPVAQSSGQTSLRRAFAVTIALESTDAQRMRPGMSVKAMVHTRSATDVLLAPRAALDLDGKRARLADGGETEVDIDWCTPQMCVIRSGLTEGTRLRARGAG